jgi:hypothetical protein
MAYLFMLALGAPRSVHRLVSGRNGRGGHIPRLRRRPLGVVDGSLSLQHGRAHRGCGTPHRRRPPEAICPREAARCLAAETWARPRR